MKFLTIRQPWASLIAVGAKTIETRGWSTSFRGPLAIHAGKAEPENGSNLGGEFGIDVLRYSPTGCPLGSHCWGDSCPSPLHRDLTPYAGANCVLNPGDFYAYRRPNPPGKVDTFWPLPLGAVVAVCDLIDVVPIVDAEHYIDAPCVIHGRKRPPYFRSTAPFPELVAFRDPLQEGADVTDQLPFGDYAPGRFAWLLDNVRPLDPVPMKGAQGLRDLPADVVIP